MLAVVLASGGGAGRQPEVALRPAGRPVPIQHEVEVLCGCQVRLLVLLRRGVALPQPLEVGEVGARRGRPPPPGSPCPAPAGCASRGRARTSAPGSSTPAPCRCKTLHVLFSSYFRPREFVPGTRPRGAGSP